MKLVGTAKSTETAAVKQMHALKYPLHIQKLLSKQARAMRQKQSMAVQALSTPSLGASFALLLHQDRSAHMYNWVPMLTNKMRV